MKEILQEIEEIKKLKAKYCYYVDGYFEDETMLDKLVNEIFAEDSTVDFSPFGTAKGRSAIKDWFKNVCYKNLSFCMHMVHNPIIEIIQENKALGTWYFEVPCTIQNPEILNQIKRKTSTASWLTGKYEEEYEKINGKWYIKSLKVKWTYWTPYDRGWEEENIIPQK